MADIRQQIPDEVIKAASTAALATDPSLVVQLSPNSPILQSDTNISGTISATDALAPAPGGAGVLINTAPTASSFVAAAVPGGTSQADVQITGTATGTYYFEASTDSTTGSDGNWIAINYRQSGISNTTVGFSFTTNGVFRGAPSGFKYIRIRNVGGTTPSNPVIVRFSNGGGTMFLNASLPAGTNTIGALTANQSVNNAQIAGVATSTGNGVTSTGSQRVTIASDNTAFSVNANIAAAQTLATVTTVGTITNAINVGSKTTGGLTTHTLISAATTNATSVKASAGTVYGIQASNTGAAVAFVKLFNKASAPTVGTDVAVKTLIVPAGGGIVVPINDIGLSFGTGVAYSITALATTADTTAVALAQVVVNIDYA